MPRPEFASHSVAATLAQEAERIALPLGNGAAGGGFSALMNQVRGEVTAFISGSSDGFPAGMSAVSLSAEGVAHRARIQGVVSDQSGGVGATKAQQQDFIASMAPWARQAADRLGVAPELVTAHAALESGWGQRPLRGSDGNSTHNLFGLKAGGNWSGDVARALTTEVEEGVAIRRHEDFRSYADEAGAFSDYADLLLGNSRYGSALNAGDNARAFALGLTQGRYATDPAYAEKLERVARQVKDIGLPARSAELKADY